MRRRAGRLIAGVLLVLVVGNAQAQPVDVRRGEGFFNTRFVAAPSSAALRDGLGPLFNAAACDQCHHRSGRRLRPGAGQSLPTSTVVQLSQRGADGVWTAHPVYGTTFNPLAVAGVRAEGRVTVHWQRRTGRYPDGQAWQLSVPEYQFEDLAYGPLGEQIAFSPRSGRPLAGIGLLARIPEPVLLALADPGDRNGDGIAGQPNWITVAGQRQLGRFGWKANHATLESQITAALANEQGVTSTLRSQDDCTAAQQSCQRAPQGGAPEMADADLANLVAFVASLPAPKPEPVGGHEAGAQVFSDVGCQACHRSSIRWREGDRWVRIEPYTDMLLHDLGAGLADHRPDQSASGRQWRTAPLWGLGMARRAGLPSCYLHDCRARTLEAAILWHGGEATDSRQAFSALSATRRQALLDFLKSL